MNPVLLLIALLICHNLAAFCLTITMMIRAKADGKPVWHILLHAAVHALLMGVCIFLFGVDLETLVLLMGLELTSHFAIDTFKARITSAIPLLADARRKPYWIVYGLDQLLHQLIVVAIWFLATYDHPQL